MQLTLHDKATVFPLPVAIAAEIAGICLDESAGCEFDDDDE